MGFAVGYSGEAFQTIRTEYSIRRTDCAFVFFFGLLRTVYNGQRLGPLNATRTISIKTGSALYTLTSIRSAIIINTVLNGLYLSALYRWLQIKPILTRLTSILVLVLFAVEYSFKWKLFAFFTIVQIKVFFAFLAILSIFYEFAIFNSNQFALFVEECVWSSSDDLINNERNFSLLSLGLEFHQLFVSEIFIQKILFFAFHARN